MKIARLLQNIALVLVTRFGPIKKNLVLQSFGFMPARKNILQGPKGCQTGIVLGMVQIVKLMLLVWYMMFLVSIRL
jgi:hypothetical protein